MIDSKSVRTLKAARAKVEAGWTQRAAARDAAGQAVGWSEPKACSYCSMGALWLVSDGSADRAELWLIWVLQRRNAGHSVISFNDDRNRTKDDVLKLFDDAIELAKGAE